MTRVLGRERGSRRRQELPPPMSLPRMRRSFCINAPCVFISGGGECAVLKRAFIPLKGKQIPCDCHMSTHGADGVGV